LLALLCAVGEAGLAAPHTVVDFADKLASFDERWQPRIIGQVNDLHLKVVKLLGEEECHLLLVEPAGTPNTGDLSDSDRTAAAQWI
jgi:hypothetical protein